MAGLLQDRHAAERSVAAVYNRAAPGEGGLPLRLLHNFYLYVQDPTTGIERAAGLEELHNGEPPTLSWHLLSHILGVQPGGTRLHAMRFPSWRSAHSPPTRVLGACSMQPDVCCTAGFLSNCRRAAAVTGKVGALLLRARGTLLEHRALSPAGGDAWGGGGASNGSKGRIHLANVRDWVVDHSQPAHAIWLVTSTAWYRSVLRLFCEYIHHSILAALW